MINPAWFNPKPVAPVTDTAQETELVEGQPGQVIGGKITAGKSFQPAKVDPTAQMFATLAQAAKDSQSIIMNTGLLKEGVPQAQGEERRRQALERQDKTLLDPIEAQLADDLNTREGTKTLDFTNESGVTETRTYNMANEGDRRDYARERFRAAAQGLDLKSPTYQKRVSEQEIFLYNNDLKGDRQHIVELLEKRETMLLRASADDDPSNALTSLSATPDNEWDKLNKEITTAIAALPKDKQTELVQLRERQDINLQQSISEENTAKFEVAVQTILTQTFGALVDKVNDINNRTLSPEQKTQELLQYIAEEGLLAEDTSTESLEDFFDQPIGEKMRRLKDLLKGFTEFQSATEGLGLSSHVIDHTLQGLMANGRAYSSLAASQREQDRARRNSEMQTELAVASNRITENENNPLGQLEVLGSTQSRVMFDSGENQNLVSPNALTLIEQTFPSNASSREGTQSTVTEAALGQTVGAVFNGRFRGGAVNIEQGLETFTAQAKDNSLDPSFAAVLEGRNSAFVERRNDGRYLTSEGVRYVYGEFDKTKKEVRRSNAVQENLFTSWNARINTNKNAPASERFETYKRLSAEYVRSATGSSASDEDIVALLGQSGTWENNTVPPSLSGLSFQRIKQIETTIKGAEKNLNQVTATRSRSDINKQFGLESDREEPVSMPELLDAMSSRKEDEKTRPFLDRVDVFVTKVDEEFAATRARTEEAIALDKTLPEYRTLNEIADEQVDLPLKRKLLQEAQDAGNEKEAANLEEEIRALELVSMGLVNGYKAQQEIKARYLVRWAEEDKDLVSSDGTIDYNSVKESRRLENFSLGDPEFPIFDEASGKYHTGFVESVYAGVIEIAEDARGGAESSEMTPGNQERYAEFYKSIQNFYNRMFQNLSDGQLSPEGRQAAMALAFIGEHIRRLDTKPDGNSTTILLGNGELLEVPTFSSGNFVRGTLQAQEGDGAATTPFGIYALIDWAEEVIRPRAEGQPAGIQNIQEGMDDYWQTSLGVLVAGMAVANMDGSMHDGDMATADQGQATGSRRQQPRKEIRDASAAMQKGDSSTAVNHIAEAIGIEGAHQTIVNPNPASLSSLASAANELGMEINVPSPIDGRDIGFKELLGELAFVENTIKQNRQRLKDEGIEIPTFSIDGLADITKLSPDQRRRAELADGKDIFDVLLVAGDIPQIQEAIGDLWGDWQAFGIGFLAHDDTGFDLGTGGVNAEGFDVTLNTSHYHKTLDAVRQAFVTGFTGLAEEFHKGSGTASPSGLPRAINGVRMANDVMTDESFSLSRVVEQLRHMRHYQNGPLQNIGQTRVSVHTGSGSMSIRNIDVAYRNNRPDYLTPVRRDGEVVLSTPELAATSALAYTPTPENQVRFVNEMFGRYQDTNPEGYNNVIRAARTQGLNTVQLLKLIGKELNITDRMMDLDPTTNGSAVRWGMTSQERDDARGIDRYVPNINYMGDSNGHVTLQWGSMPVTALPPYMFPSQEHREQARGRVEAFVEWRRNWDENGWPMFNNPRRYIDLRVGDMPQKQGFYDYAEWVDTPTEYDSERETAILKPYERRATMKVKKEFQWNYLDRVQAAWNRERKSN